jgi:ribosomal protein L11 methyltransferase
VDCHGDAQDAVSGLLLDEGALGLETVDDETRAVPGKPFLPTGRAQVTATFPRADGLEARVMGRLVALATHLEAASDITAEWSDLFAEDWTAIFKAHWKPFRLGQRVWIVPSWERANFSAERIGAGREPLVLHLDPGMAFGTGQHETTQLCTEALESVLDAGTPIAHLLDVGTGTGILSLVALKLGAKRAVGTDIDPVACAAAKQNARDNGVGERFVDSEKAPDAWGPVFDGVVANILAGTLIEMADAITRALAPRGRLWLSGILVDQAAAVERAYVARGLVHERTVAKGDWVRIDLRRP